MCLGSQLLCDPYSLKDGDSAIGPGVGQERGHDILDRSQGHILPDIHFPGFSAIPQDRIVEQSLIITESVPHLLEHWELLFNLQRPGESHQLGEIRPQASQPSSIF